MVPSPEPRAARRADQTPPCSEAARALPGELPTDGTVVLDPPLDRPMVLDVELTATVDHAALLRRRFRAWLVALTGDIDLVEDLVLAVYEALANAVDHAYRAAAGPGVVMLYAELTDTHSDGRHQPRQLHIRITDRGTWHRPADDPGGRGRGLALMRGLTDTLRLERAASGTIVHLHRHLPDRSPDQPVS